MLGLLLLLLLLLYCTFLLYLSQTRTALSSLILRPTNSTPHPPPKHPHILAAMRPQRSGFALPSALLLLPVLASAVTFDCSHLRIDGQSFDLSNLRGPHSVHLIEDTPPSLSNTTFTIDICSPLQRTKGVPKADECPSGTRG